MDLTGQDQGNSDDCSRVRNIYITSLQYYIINTPMHSIENAPVALASLFEGKNTGKLLVQVDKEEGDAAAKL